MSPLIGGELAGLGIDDADRRGLEVEQIEIVLAVGADAVDAEALAVAVAERAEVLPLAALDIEPQDLRAVGVLHPDLAVDMGECRIEMAGLGRVGLPFLRDRPGLERLGLLVEARDAGLVHHADPGIAVLVEAEIERADRIAGLQHRDRIFRDLAGLRIHLAEELLAEVREPDHALLVEHDVVRLDLPARQIVFGDDDAVGAAGQARQRLQRIGPGFLAEIDRGEIFRDHPHVRPLAERALRVADEPLRMLRRAARVIADHPVEDVDELLAVVLRAHDAVEVVAADAVEELPSCPDRCRGSSRTIRRSTSAWRRFLVGAELDLDGRRSCPP